MCGILGILSSQPVAENLLQGLSRLEYRGYDSAGIATIHNSQIDRRRASGKLKNLKTLIGNSPLEGTIGIGHTRWATHGAANTTNAHPHSTPDVAVVHNGIIENFSTLKQSLQEKGITFESDTDTEVVVHLITDFLKNKLSPLQAVQQTLQLLQGAFALVILFRDHPDLMVATRRGSPLVLGSRSNKDELFVASDALALVGWATQLCYLEEGDIAVLEKTETDLSTHLYTSEAHPVKRAWRPNQLSAAAVTKADYSHFMLKEIFEQPAVLSDSIQSLIGVEGVTVDLPSLLKLDSQLISQVFIIACGTSYYAGLVAKYWFEKYFQLPTQVEVASEFRYRNPCLDRKALYLFLSQSGETIDTLAALTLVKQNSCQTLAIVNVPESSIARQSNQVFYTLAGPEIGVASTKAFTAQLASLLGLGLYLRKGDTNFEVYQELRLLPRLVTEVLQDQSKYQHTALKLSQAQHALYLGRGLQYPIALEGALKLKELSYIHAEGYAAGELKHGPIALIDGQMPVVVVAPYDEWFEKTLSNMQEVLARSAQVIILTDEIGASHVHQQVSNKSTLEMIILPKVASITSPFIYTIAVQLLAYYAAFHKGTDIDQPRNLAKSVTVE